MLDDTQREPAARPRTRRLQVGMRPLLVLVACCGVLFWVARIAWENRDPEHAVVRRKSGRCNRTT